MSIVIQQSLIPKPILVAYLLHLVAPLLLLLDVLLAWRFPSDPSDSASVGRCWVDFGTTGQLLFMASTAWQILGLSLLGAVVLFRLIS